MLRRNARYFRMLVLTGATFCVLMWTRGVRHRPVALQVQSREEPSAGLAPTISQETLAEAKAANDTEAELEVPAAETESSCQHELLTSLDTFYEFIHKIDIKCTNLMQMAGPTDHTLLEGRRVCTDSEYITRDHCLVYLFGLGGDWSFAEEVERKLGCKVFVFDPSMEQGSRNLSSNIAFYKMSVSSDFGVSGDPPKKDQLLRIMEMLGHEESTIDLLWVDMPAGEELFLLDDLFSSSQQIIGNIKQIGIDIYPMNEGLTERIRKYWYYFQQLTCHDLRLVTRQPNIEYENLFKLNNKTRSNIYELLWAREI